MPTKTEKAPPQGLPNTTQISNGSVAAPAGKTDALGAYRREELARLQRQPGFELLRPIEAHVLRYVVKRYLSPSQGIFASQATIASKMRLHQDTVRKALRAIVKAELLTVERRGAYNRGRGGRTSNRYLLVASEDNIQRSSDPVTSPAPDPVSDPVTSRGKTASLQGVIASTPYAKEVLRTSNVKELCSKEPSVVASKEAPTVESQIASGEVFELELPDSLIREKNSQLVGGIEPPPRWDMYLEISLGLLGFGELEASYAYVVNTTAEQKGSVAKPVETEDEAYWREHRRRKAAGLCNDCGGSSGLEIYRDCLRCATCRAAHEEIDRKYKLGRFAEQQHQAEDDLPPWERESLAPPELMPWEQPPKQETDEDALARIERKLDELPVSVAIAVGGHPAEEAEQALADAERGL